MAVLPRQRMDLPRTGLIGRHVVQHLAEVGGGLLITQCTVEGCRPAGRERDQPAALPGCPSLECLHQCPADTATTILVADKNLLDPGHPAVCVEGEVLEAQEVA